MDSTNQIPIQTKRFNTIKLLLIFLIAIMVFFVVLTSFVSAKSRAADQVQVTDIGLIQKFLEAYKQDYGMYPQEIQGQPYGFENYLEFLPVPPAGYACSGSNGKYKYALMNSGASYSLIFCLKHATDGFHSGSNQVGPK